MNRPSLPKESRASDQNPLSSQCSQYFARLMTPIEVARATARQPIQVRQKTEGHWLLCGDVSAPMFSLLREVPKQNFPTRLTGFNSPGGFGYGVITHQVLRQQHRFVLSLYDPAVRSFLESMSKQQVTFMLGNNDGNDALLLENPIKPIEFLPLLAMNVEASLEEQRRAIQELPILMETMGNPLQVPSLLKEFSVQHVSVSFLLPGILDKSFRSALAEAAAV